jgi:lysophospholipase L1-like esterase
MATQITGTVKYTLSTGARGPEGLAGATSPPLNLTAGPVRSTAGTSSIADGALSIAKTAGLQAALNIAIDGKPMARSIAFVGDSITSYAGNTMADFERNGYVSWLKIFAGERYRHVSAPAALTFATGGLGTAAIRTAWFDLVMASTADVVFLNCGTNDSTLLTSQQCADLVIDLWLDIRAGGKTPIGSSITPFVGNSTKSAWIVATNAILRAAAAENGILFCDWTGELENVADSNTGVSNTTYLPDSLHPGEIGASRMARYAARFLNAATALGSSPYLTAKPKSRNVRLAGSGGQPTGFQVPFMPTGATLNSKTLIPDPETGGFWLELDVSAGSASSTMQLAADFGTAPSINGLTVYGLCEIQVVSGSFFNAHAFASVFDPTNTLRRTLANLDVPFKNCAITAADGLIRCKSPAITPTAPTYYSATFAFFGTGVIRIRRLGLYSDL